MMLYSTETVMALHRIREADARRSPSMARRKRSRSAADRSRTAALRSVAAR